jgi:signal transduction histidine kinase/DNA-binding NarL/FixJ family response regulator
LSAIRPALITRLYKAIDQNRLSDAILLLTQQYDGTQLDPEARATHFLREIREEGERQLFSEKTQAAEEHFAIALALYDRFFPHAYAEGIALVRRLSELMSEEKRDAELARALDYAWEVVKRLEASARPDGVILQHGAIADSLVRRHQIGAYVDSISQRKVVGGTTRPLRVLIVEDNDDDALLARDALTSTDALPIETESAQMLSEGIDKLRDGDIDVVVLDLGLPDSDSLRTLQRVRDKAPNIPVVILTGQDDDDFAMRAIKCGAHDYLVKGRTNSAMLLRAVLRAAEDQFVPKVPEIPISSVNALIEFAPSGMMHLSNDLTVYAMNRAFIELVGADWCGKVLSEIWPDFTVERLIEATEQGGGVQLTELPLPSASAHKGAVDLAIWPTRTPERTTDGMICMVSHYRVPKLVTLNSSETTHQTENRELEAQLAAGRREEQVLRARVVQQTALASISQIAQVNAESEEQLFEHAIEAASEAIRADHVMLLQRTDDNRLIVRAMSSHDNKPTSKLEGDLDLEPLYHMAYNASSAIIINDISEETFTRPPKALLALGIKSGIIAQVRGRERPYGLLAAFHNEKHALREGDAVFLAALASILAASIERKNADEQLGIIAEELKRSNDDLQQFAYAAAHDLQEPLRSVVSYLELLQGRLEGTLDEKSQKYMSVAMNGGKRMQALISDLLEYSRLSTRAKAMTRTDMNEVIRYVADNLSTSIQESGAKLDMQPLPIIHADSSQMVQLFQNLVSNAIKFRKPDVAPEIKVRAKEQSREVEFIVQDNGIGFEMEYANRIFIIFQRLHTRQKYGGTGIGLALAKKIVERHGGRIWVQSKPNEGTTFHFTIPNRGNS